MNELAGRTILVLEDLFYLAMDVKTILEKAGAEILGPFSSAGAALKGMADRVPDCAVLDVNLGAGASFEVARALRLRAVSFLFFTGYDASAIPREFGDIPRLQKPVDASRLLEAVSVCCRSTPLPT